METKLSIVQDHMRAGRWQQAIRIAARFHRLDQHCDAILSYLPKQQNPRQRWAGSGF